MKGLNSFHEYALDQLREVAPITHRRMFGGVGVYSAGFFFALMDDEKLYLKVGDLNRADFESLGIKPFRPFEDKDFEMSYYPLPEEVIEEVDELRQWVNKALAVARMAKKPKTTKKSR